MQPATPVQHFNKLLRHWASRRERDIVLRVEFTREDAGGCRLFRIERVVEFDD
jgi:hypothetical protein